MTMVLGKWHIFIYSDTEIAQMVSSLEQRASEGESSDENEEDVSLLTG